MKRKLPKQLIFTLLGILIIAGSIPMAVLLVKQRQEIRKEASGQSCGAMGGTVCLQSGNCPSGTCNLGTSTEPPGGIPCTKCCGPCGGSQPTTAPVPGTATGSCSPVGQSCSPAGAWIDNCCRCSPGPDVITGLDYSKAGTQGSSGWCACASKYNFPSGWQSSCGQAPATSGQSCGAMGGTVCLQSGDCPSGTCNLGTSTEPPGGIPCTKCCGSCGGSQSTTTNNVGTWGLYFTNVSCPSTNQPTPIPTKPTVTPTLTITPTITPTPTITSTPTPTPTTPVSCNETCSIDSQCSGSLICSSSHCRNVDCTGETDCSCPEPTATPTPGPTSTPTPGPTSTLGPNATPTPVVELPKAGFTLPTFGFVLGGILLVITSLVFIL